MTASLRVYGSMTSPYVRRVRVLALELGLSYEFVDTTDEDGQATLRSRTPIWKIPAAELDGDLVLDSHDISELMLVRHGGDRLQPLSAEDLRSRNAINVVDGALDALINVMYLGREGVTPEAAPYLQKQRDRAGSAMSWLEARIDGGFLGPQGVFGLPEIALGTTLAWMRFREAYDVSQHPKLHAFLAGIDARPSFEQTRPG